MAKVTTKKSAKKDVKEIVEEKANATSSSESSSSDDESSSSSSSSDSSSSEPDSSSSSSESESESESDSSDDKEEEEQKDSSSESEDDSSSDSSGSSESESESDSESSDDEEEQSKKEEEKQNETSFDSSDSSSSESESDSDSESSDDGEEQSKKEEEKQNESSSDSSSDDESDSSSSSSSESESEQESKKRKLEGDEDEVSAEKSSSNPKKSKSNEPATIFVGRLSWSIDDEWLKNEFEHIGGVLGARVIMERGSNRSRGYGYVDFESVEYAEKAIKEMHGKEIDGRPINCDISTSKPSGPSAGFGERAKKYGDVPSEPSDTLFLGNLSFNVNRDQLYDLFGKYGEIVSVRIPTHPETEQPKGFGYVQFTNKDDAKKALDALQGEYIENRPVRLDFSTPKPPRDNGNNRGNKSRGNNGPRREFRGSGANNAPLGKQRNTAAFAGTKKTFD